MVSGIIARSSMAIMYFILNIFVPFAGAGESSRRTDVYQV